MTPFGLPPRPGYPQEVRDAVQVAALLEIKWRVSHYEGQMLRWNTDQLLEREAKIVLARYADILADYYWACFVSPATGNMIIAVVPDTQGESDLAVLAHYHPISNLPGYSGGY